MSNMSNNITAESTCRPWSIGITSIVRAATALPAVFCLATAEAQSTLPRFESDYMLVETPIESVKLTDTFWHRRLETNRKVSADHCIAELEKAHAIDLFRDAIKRAADPNFVPPEEHKPGHPCRDSDTYKVLQGILQIQRNNPDPVSRKHLREQVDKLIDLIDEAQRKAGRDGYFFPFVHAFKPEGTETLEGALQYQAALYSMGHLFEMCCDHFEVTGDKQALNIAVRVADGLVKHLGLEEGQLDFIPTHAEPELALVRLYRVTGNGEYLKLADYMVQGYKRRAKYSRPIPAAKKKQRMDKRKSWGLEERPEWAAGPGRIELRNDDVLDHMVHSMYLFAGAVDVAQLTGDKSLMDIIEKKWFDATQRKMQISGGCGVRNNAWHTEAFASRPYDLDPNVYSETCSSIAMCLWNYRMFLATGDAKYMNVLEKTLYNAVLSGIAANGREYLYVNPLEDTGYWKRFTWHACACCPANAIRFLPLVQTYLYSTNEETDDIYVNLFVQSETKLRVQGRDVVMTQETGYPYDGKVTIRYKADAAKPLTIRVRKPAWAQEVTWTLDGKNSSPRFDRGYAVFKVTGKSGEIVLDAEMPVVRMAGNPNIKQVAGRVALMRGPLVYCFEDCEGRDPFSITLAKDQKFTMKELQIIPELKVIAITAQDNAGQDVTAIPFFGRTHRGAVRIRVWTVKHEGKRPCKEPSRRE